MIAKITRGGNAPGLMHYLVGPGKTNEHEHPHLVAGSAGLMTWYSTDELGTADAYRIGMHLEQPNREYGTEVTAPVKELDEATSQLVPTGERKAAHMWHCSLSLAPDHEPLDDEKWGAIAADFADEMGFTETSGKASCRWAAVHHGTSKNGGDHIHLAVNLVREDGTKASVHYDFKKASRIAAQLEGKYGLEVVDGRRVGRSARAESQRELAEVDDKQRAENARANAAGEPPRQVETYSGRLSRTVRGCAVASSDEAEFVRRLRREGLWVRPRFAAGTQDVIVGFAAAEPPRHGARAEWRAAGKLGRDLTLPRLRQGWEDSPTTSTAAAVEWKAAWRGAPIAEPGREEIEVDAKTWEKFGRQLRAINQHLAEVSPDDHAAWAQAAGETSGALAAWSLRLEQEPGSLAAASDLLARSAAQHRRSTPLPRARVSMHGTASALIGLAVAGPSSKTGQAIVIRELMRTVRAIGAAHDATRQSRYAAAVATGLRRDLEQVATQLKPALQQATEPPAGPASTTRPPGQPLPNQINPAQHRVGRGRDGRDFGR